MNILVINGPNINLLGLREPDIYGKGTYNDLLKSIEKWSDDIGVRTKCVQSNHEGDIVDFIQSAYGSFDGIVINPAAYTHTSVAILDALKAVSIPAVEVHITDPETRESFRHISYAGMACVKTVKGKGFLGYKEALEYLKQTLDANA
ncbi:MAG: type II 3-dehydroquinate dehydratase [Clostridia bacterium]|nr:type II 3-dehydroquinate dehydratase [Clostridia bacterium]